jgi:hypothetical protein
MPLGVWRAYSSREHLRAKPYAYRESSQLGEFAAENWPSVVGTHWVSGAARLRPDPHRENAATGAGTQEDRPRRVLSPGGFARIFLRKLTACVDILHLTKLIGRGELRERSLEI